MLERILGKDPDEMFPYQTIRTIRIKDKILSAISWFLFILTLVYFVFYLFISQMKWADITRDVGYSYYSFSGKAFSRDTSGNIEAWEAADLVYPIQDSTGLFIGVHLYKISGQSLGYCGDTCTLDSDCPDTPPLKLPTCNNEGFCD